MNLECTEFNFALEMIIVSRNESGATLFDIRGDYFNLFGKTLDSVFGFSGQERVRTLLLNTMDNIFARTLPNGRTIFFTNVARFREKLSVNKSENIKAILRKLNIDPQKIKPFNNKNEIGQNSFNSHGSISTSSVSSMKLAEFYNHTLIADDFLLELSNIDLHLKKRQINQAQCIGLCISGQTMKSAYRTISYSSFNFLTEKVIINIGTFDLLNGRFVVNMIADIVRLLNALKRKKLIPILTTLAPLPNHLPGELEERRQSFNKFIRENFTAIDIEKCFLSNENRVLLECYQPNPKSVSGSKHIVLLWNRVGRQRVLQFMKQEIPHIHSIL